MKTYNVLIIDDHPILAETYGNAFLQIAAADDTIHFNIDMANTIDAALAKIENTSTASSIDLIFLDIKLPKSSDGKYLSGEDLGIRIRELLSDVKIIVNTTHNDNFRVNNILKSIDPDAFLVKSDITHDDLVIAIKDVITDIPHYSKTVLRLFRNYMANDFFLDKIDRQLLHELSIGTKMIDLPEILPMSRSGIERRKRQLKELFNVTKREDDKALVEAAKEKGFI